METAAGVIDQDYRGNVGVVLFNFGKEDFKGMFCTIQCNTQCHNPYAVLDFCWQTMFILISV